MGDKTTSTWNCDKVSIDKLCTFLLDMERSYSLLHSRNICDNNQSVCSFWLDFLTLKAHFMLQSIVWATDKESGCECGCSMKKKKKTSATDRDESDGESDFWLSSKFLTRKVTQTQLYGSGLDIIWNGIRHKLRRFKKNTIARCQTRWEKTHFFPPLKYVPSSWSPFFNVSV